LTKSGGPTAWPATSPDFTLLNCSCGAISKTGSMRLCGATLLSFGLFAYKEQFRSVKSGDVAGHAVGPPLLVKEMFRTYRPFSNILF
jgi:hypothetical protein